MCFQECGSLTTVTASPQLNCIGSSAFRFCYNLGTVTLGDTVEEVGDNAFYYCFALGDINLGVLQRMGAQAFVSCRSLSTITLPVDVDTTDRFDGCAISTVYYTAGKTGVMPDRQTADPRANIPFRIPWNTRTGPR